jgi:phosphinothricin acetyltransferase
MVNSLFLRAAVPADTPAIAAIYAEAVRTGTASFEIAAPDPAEMRRRIVALLDAGFPCLVAGTGRAIGGYAYAGPYHARAAYAATVEDSIYVAPPAQRRGLGRALLAGLIEAAERGGFRQMIAVIGDSANAGSIGLHAAMGFRVVGTHTAVGRKHGRWLDTVHMQRPLGAGAELPPLREP